jgi:di/tricarboxylate transporter
VNDVTPQQLAFGAILLVAIVLLVTERLRPDLVALLIIVSLAFTHILSTSDAFSGLSSEPAIVIACMFVLSAGLQTTGISELMSRVIGKLAGHSQARVLAVMMGAAAIPSAFTHHVMITGVMLPITLKVARERDIPASKLLMPVAIASSLGTTITLLPPAFLVAGALLQQSGRPGLGLFAIAPIGLTLTATGLAYMLLVGRFLVPRRRSLQQADEALQLDSYVTELRVLEKSPLIGHTLQELRSDDRYPFKAYGMLRGGRKLTNPAERPVEKSDVLVVRTNADGLATIRQEPGWELEPVMQYGADVADDEKESAGPNTRDDEAEMDKVQQAVVAPRSWFAGRTLADVDFRRRYRVVVLGIWRRTRLLPDELSRITLSEGDVLVLQGSTDAFNSMANDSNFLLLTPFQGQVRRPRKSLVAGLVMLGTIVGATIQQVGLGLAAITGATAMVVTGCLTPRQAYRAVDPRMYLFVAGAIPLGLAMKNTGTADLLANWLHTTLTTWDERLILFVLFVLVGIIVQFMGSDSATVALFGPIAIALAGTLGQAPEAYVVTVAVAAVTAILTPMSHHNLIIYAPGGYRFFDYARVGAPLTLMLAVATAALAPRVWP